MAQILRYVASKLKLEKVKCTSNAEDLLSPQSDGYDWSDGPDFTILYTIIKTNNYVCI